jgi:hypothetical protein
VVALYVRRLRRGTVQRIELVKLIEAVIAKLSHQGRETWEEMERLALMRPLDKDLTPELLRIWETEAPAEEQASLKILILLSIGLAAEYLVDDSGEEQRFREVFVIKAAQVWNHAEDRLVDPDMSVEQAIARLERRQDR